MNNKNILDKDKKTLPCFTSTNNIGTTILYDQEQMTKEAEKSIRRTLIFPPPLMSQNIVR